MFEARVYMKKNHKPIRILIVDGKLICGGVEAFLMNIYRHIDRTKVQFDFLVHYKEKFFYDDEVKKLGGKIYRLSFRNDKNYIKYKKDLNKFFKSHIGEYKVVWGHMDGLASIYLRAAKKYGYITICHSHITSSEKSLKGVVKRILRKDICKYADYKFACSTEAGKYLYGNEKFKLIPNAIDVNKFVFNEEIRNEIRQKNNWENKFVLGHVGRFNDQKNHKYLIEIFKELYIIDNQAILCLCGDGENRKDIEQLVKNLHLDKSVIFLGNISNMNEYYQAFDAFVLPSLYEGLPVSGIEAQVSGLKCYFADTITKEASIISENTYYLSLEATPAKWAKKIIKNKIYNRNDKSNKIKESGYDIFEESKLLEKFFIRLN